MSQPILFTPGPVRIPPAVAAALAEPPCNYHRQSGFRAMFAETQAALSTLIGLRDPAAYLTTILTTTGTGANEACLAALAGLGEGLILRNGFFGARLVDQAVQAGLAHQVLDGPPDRPLEPAEVAAVLDANPQLRWCYFVGHETRVGLRNPMIALGRVCAARGVLVGADVISSAFAYPIDLEAAELDLAVASSAKGIMAVPGLGIVFVKRAALPRLERAARPRGYYLDVLAEGRRQQAEREPRFAQPVALHAALHAACRHLAAIGVDQHFARIQRQMDTVAAHLARLGLRPLLDRAHLSWIAVNFELPAGLRYPDFAARMQAEGYFVLYGVPGDDRHFQVSTIGHLTDDDVAGLGRALDRVLVPVVAARAHDALVPRLRSGGPA